VTEKSRKKFAALTLAVGGWGWGGRSRSHSHKVSQAALVTSDWQAEPQGKATALLGLKSSRGRVRGWLTGISAWQVVIGETGKEIIFLLPKSQS
jgi:hypothetical protein